MIYEDTKKKHPINNNDTFLTRVAGKAIKFQNYSKNVVFVTYLKNCPESIFNKVVRDRLKRILVGKYIIIL